MSHFKSQHPTIYNANAQATGVGASNKAGASGQSCQVTSAIPSYASYNGRKLQECHRSVAGLCVRDGRAFNMITTPAFKHTMMTVSGNRYPGTSVDMVKKHIDSMYEHMVRIVNQEEMQNRLPGSMTIAFDAWTSAADDPYLGVLAYWVAKDWKVGVRVLALKHFTTSHNAIATANLVKEIVEDYGLKPEDVSYYMCDNASVMVATETHLAPWVRLPCAVHWLQLTVVDCLGLRVSPGAGNDYAAPEVHSLLKKVRQGVSFFNRSSKAKLRLLGIQTDVLNLPFAVKPIGDMATRWSSTYLMLERWLRLRRALAEFISAHDEVLDWALDDGEWLMLKQVAAVLRPFYEVTNELQADKQVSISRVLPCMLQLIDSLRTAKSIEMEPARYSHNGKLLEAASYVQPGDILEPVKTLRSSLMQSMDQRWRIGSMMEPHIQLFQLAASLDPRNRGHLLLQKEEMWGLLRELVKGECLERADELAGLIIRDETLRATAIWDQLSTSLHGNEDKDDEEKKEGSDGDSDAEAAPPVGTSRHQSVRVRGWSASYYSQATTSSRTSAPSSTPVESARAIIRRSLDSELAKYFSDQYQPLPIHFDPIAYWRASGGDYPVLSKLAILILSIPASSAGVERFFSLSGNTVSKLRTCLAPERVNKMMMLQQNWDDRYYCINDEELKKIAGKKGSKKRKRMDELLDNYVEDEEEEEFGERDTSDAEGGKAE